MYSCYLLQEKHIDTSARLPVCWTGEYYYYYLTSLTGGYPCNTGKYPKMAIDYLR